MSHVSAIDSAIDSAIVLTSASVVDVVNTAKPGKVRPAFNAPVAGVLIHVDPRALKVEAGYNVRKFRPDADKDDAALLADIRGAGVCQPLTVRECRPGSFTIVAGHRRHAASVMLHKLNQASRVDTIPCMVLEGNPDKVTRLYDLKRSNSGKPLSALQLARVVVALFNEGESAEDIAREWEMTTRYVSNMRVIGSCPADIQDAMEAGRISASLVYNIIQEATAALFKAQVDERAAATLTAYERIRGLLAGTTGKVTAATVSAHTRTVAGASPVQVFTADGLMVKDAAGFVVCDAATPDYAKRIAAALSAG